MLNIADIGRNSSVDIQIVLLSCECSFSHDSMYRVSCDIFSTKCKFLDAINVRRQPLQIQSYQPYVRGISQKQDQIFIEN